MKNNLRDILTPVSKVHGNGETWVQKRFWRAGITHVDYCKETLERSTSLVEVKSVFMRLEFVSENKQKDLLIKYKPDLKIRQSPY